MSSLRDSWDETGPRRYEKLCVVIACNKYNSKEELRQTVEGFLKQEERESVALLVWCVDCPLTIVEFAREFGSKLSVIESPHTFLGNLPASLASISQFELETVILCFCGIVPKSDCITFLLRKLSEYENSAILTAVGIRIFPHEKLSDAKEGFQNGKYLKCYNETKEDRAVHLLTTNFCCISINSLIEASKYHHPEFCILDNIWFSFVIQYHLEEHIWKINMKDTVTVQQKCPQVLLPFATNIQLELLTRFYSHIYKLDWPKGISKPFYSLDKLKAAQSSSSSPMALWDRGFGGVNMQNEPACPLDFAAAASYGVRVIRSGAVGDAKDLAYLINPNATSFEADKAHFLTVLPRLVQSLCNARQFGLKVIITLADVPGCGFYSRPEDSLDFPFWDSSDCRTRVAKFWGLLAEYLAEQKDTIMGYDLINEPYTSEDTAVDYFDEMPMNHLEELHQFQLDAIKEIRKHDKNTMVVVKGTWYASPRAIQILKPLPDLHVVYAFHMYASPSLTLPTSHTSGTLYSYPGPVSRWVKYKPVKIELNRPSLSELLHSTVRQWQLKHGVPSNRILVAEFGICRTVHGAKQYLTDLIEIFQGFGWSWLLFSFRDEEWDALDYELGTDSMNMLTRSPSDLFMSVAQHLC